MGVLLFCTNQFFYIADRVECNRFINPLQVGHTIPVDGVVVIELEAEKDGDTVIIVLKLEKSTK